MGEFHATTPEQESRLRPLAEAGLLVETGVPGLYARGQAFERIRRGFDALVDRWSAQAQAEGVYFPPLIPRRQLERSGYLGSFPHLAGTVFAFEGTEPEAIEQNELATRHDDWSGFQRMSDMVLTPAACYPLYPAIAARGPLPPGGVTLDTGDGYVFRREPSEDPARMQSFHMREIVRIADADTVTAWRELWRDRAAELLRSLGLDTAIEIAHDPFFGRLGRMLASAQRGQSLKWELVALTAPERPTAIASANYHQDHMGHTYGLQMEDGEPAHTACVAFGEERITLALLHAHGLTPDAWPEPVRTALGLEASTAAGQMVSLWGFDPGLHEPHPVHAAGRTYLETNCYADVLIELLHARGDEPLAMFGFILRTDWEGDQFTYFKPPYADLERLFGIEIHEMLPYRPLPEHIEEQLRLGRTVLVEIDAHYLPDTAATSYRREHLKTTIAPEAIDIPGQRLRYFHNAGFFELDGEDYRGAFRMLPHFTEDVMDPFVELVRFDAGERLSGAALRETARELLRGHFARRPERNPFVAWGERLADDLPRLLGGPLEAYHAYAFVTVRMVGAAFELCADHVEWALGADGAAAAAALRRIVEGSKIVSFRLARRRAFDPGPALGELADAWAEGMGALAEALG